jgi:hypothetical protein
MVEYLLKRLGEMMQKKNRSPPSLTEELIRMGRRRLSHLSGPGNR